MQKNRVHGYIDGSRSRGRPRQRWKDWTRMSVPACCSQAQDRQAWRSLVSSCLVSDPQLWGWTKRENINSCDLLSCHYFYIVLYHISIPSKIRICIPRNLIRNCGLSKFLFFFYIRSAVNPVWPKYTFPLQQSRFLLSVRNLSFK